MVKKDSDLEKLSDKVRRGEPIDFIEALAVIDYQTVLRVERKANKRWWHFWKGKA